MNNFPLQNKQIVGAGAILRTAEQLVLLQERDLQAPTYPGKIAPFGGGIEKAETIEQCIIRELTEELGYFVTIEDLVFIDYFESNTQPGVWIACFLIDNTNPASLVLQEGKAIRAFTMDSALDHPDVTDFTKVVLKAVLERRL